MKPDCSSPLFNQLCRGFSAIEILVVLVIAGVLMALAVPALRDLVQSNRTLSETSALASDIELARSTAIQTGTAVSMCASSNASTCNVTDGNWHSGWLAFNDINGNARLDPGETIIRNQPAFAGLDTVISTPRTNTFTFNRIGMAVNVSSGVLVVAATTPLNAALSHCLNLTPMGRPRLQAHGAPQGGC